jgi:hypothetical protein
MNMDVKNTLSRSFVNVDTYIETISVAVVLLKIPARAEMGRCGFCGNNISVC